MYHLDAHDRAVLGLALDTAMLAIVNAIEETPVTDVALEGYIFMLSEIKRVNEKLHTFLTALEDKDELHTLRDIQVSNRNARCDDSNRRSGKSTAARPKPKAN
jgi:hypothetical protein